MQTLVKAKIIQSTKGVGGGFEIPKKNLTEIKLAQIVSAIYAVKVKVKNDGTLKIGMPAEVWLR